MFPVSVSILDFTFPLEKLAFYLHNNLLISEYCKTCATRTVLCCERSGTCSRTAKKNKPYTTSYCVC